MRFIAVVGLLLLSCLVVVSATRTLSEKESQKAFSAFVKKYSKTYAHDEFFSRYTTFKRNMQIIAEHNAQNHTFSMAMNEFGDLTFQEFHSRFTGYKHVDNSYLRSKNGPKHAKHAAPAPTTVDWRTKGAVTPVKNQLQCGSCWAFSTTGAVEAGDFLYAGGVLNSLSEQQLVDCSNSTGDQGCEGGLMDNAFQWIMNNKGICSEASYPYTAADGQCQTTCSNVGGKLTGFTDVTAGSESALLAAIALNPVSVAIEADQQAFQFYSGGVFNAACGTALDHGVLAVGYGTDASTKLPYYIVKNSWGATWGEQGYIRMVRGQNQCGIANAASYPTYH